MFLTKLLLLAAVCCGAAHGKTLKYRVYEEQRVGSVIARLREDVAGVLAKLPGSLRKPHLHLRHHRPFQRGHLRPAELRS
uniref:Uncharacterized protein n=1 Tax=Neogobius melanostomus TaxID=47308 RepID=A0A8C6SJS8_9GOBI